MNLEERHILYSELSVAGFIQDNPNQADAVKALKRKKAQAVYGVDNVSQALEVSANQIQ